MKETRGPPERGHVPLNFNAVAFIPKAPPLGQHHPSHNPAPQTMTAHNHLPSHNRDWAVTQLQAGNLTSWPFLRHMGCEKTSQVWHQVTLWYVNVCRQLATEQGYGHGHFTHCHIPTENQLICSQNVVILISATDQQFQIFKFGIYW